MKRFFRIFDLSKSEQRVVLIVMLILIAVAFAGYQRRIYRFHVRTPAVSEVKASPSPAQAEYEQ